MRDDGSVRSPDGLFPVAGTWDAPGAVPGHEAGREPYRDYGNCLQVRDGRRLRVSVHLGKMARPVVRSPEDRAKAGRQSEVAGAGEEEPPRGEGGF